MRCRSPRVAGILLCGVLFGAMVALAACGSQTASPRSSQESVTTATSEGSTTATTIAVVSTDVPTTERTITSSTELITPAESSDPIMRLINGDFSVAGIQIIEARGPQQGAAAPGELYLNARLPGEQDAGAYTAIAEKILTLSEKYKQQIYFDRLRVVLTVKGGAVVYDHTFHVTPPSSTSTTQRFQVFYSAPRLQVTPREGVSLEVTVSKSRQGQVLVIVDITNKSASTFHFSREDLQLYLKGVRIEPTQEGADVPTEFAAGQGGGTVIYFTPAQFDPYFAGLLYTSSDPQSHGFTASDGPTP